jgi:SprT-like family
MRRRMPSGIRALKEDLIFTGQLPDIDGLKRELRKQQRHARSVALKPPPSIVPTKTPDDRVAITPIEYGGLQAAFDHLNKVLFDGKLPDAFITYQRHAHTRGYFSEDRFSARDGEFKKPEIALNPDTFIERSDEQIVSTLAHEMTHLRQYRFGKPSARGYHNKEWAAMMKEIGLQPSSTGAVGGKETGQRVSHYIFPGGAYAQAFAALAATGWKLNLQSAPHAGGTKAPPSKVKFTCPVCGWNVWGKPDTEVVHKPCARDMLPERPAVQSYDQAAA